MRLKLPLVTFYICGCAIVHAQTTLPDPTRPASHVSKPVAAKAYRLESTMIGKDHQLAFINGDAVSVGDQIGLGVIKSISQNQVVVMGSKKHVLIMDNGLLKMPSENRR